MLEKEIHVIIIIIIIILILILLTIIIMMMKLMSFMKLKVQCIKQIILFIIKRKKMKIKK